MASPVNARPAGPLLLVLDAGIGGGRCLIFTTDGQLVGRGYQEWVAQPVSGVPGGLDFDPVRYWADLVNATRTAVRTGAINPADVGAISVTCQREGFVLLDANDEVLYAGPSSDLRGRAENAAFAAANGEPLYSITGHLPDALHLPGRLLWLKHHRPEAFARAHRLMMINDWMLYQLSGAWVGEPSNACSSAIFDVRTGTWSADAIARAGLPREIFPPIVRSGTLAGGLLPEIAERLGLPPDTPVVVGGGDGQCGMVGAGATEAGQVAAIAGTTTPILMNVDEPVFDPLLRTWTRSGLDVGRWALEANAGITGLAFRWVRNLLFDESSEDDFPAMVRLAESVPPGANGVRCDLGAKPMSVRWNTAAAATGSVRGVGPMGGGRAEIVRAAMESTCYAVRANCDLIAEVSGREIGALRLVGGQSRSPFWVQMQADILQRHVVLPGVAEASGWGAAICAGMGIGLWPTPSAGNPSTRPAQVVEPRPDQIARYDELYHDWFNAW